MKPQGWKIGEVEEKTTKYTKRNERVEQKATKGKTEAFATAKGFALPKIGPA